MSSIQDAKAWEERVEAFTVPQEATLEAIAHALIALHDLLDAEFKRRDKYRWNRSEAELPPGSRDNL